MDDNKWVSDRFISIGTNHTNRGMPCQDACELHQDDNCIVGVVADGVSSLAKSEQASQAAASAVIKLFTEIANQKDKEYLKSLMTDEDPAKLREIKCSLFEKNKDKEGREPMGDCTLAFFFISIPCQKALIGFIGDSCVSVLTKTDSTVYTQQRSHKHDATETIYSKNAAEYLELHFIDISEDVVGFFACSDGFADEIYTKGKDPILYKRAENYINPISKPDGHETVEKLIRSGSFYDDVSLCIAKRDDIELPDDVTWLCSCHHRNPWDAVYCEKCSRDRIQLFRKKRSRFKENHAYTSDYDLFRYLNQHPDEERETVAPIKPVSKKESRSPYSDALSEKNQPRIRPDRQMDDRLTDSSGDHSGDYDTRLKADEAVYRRNAAGIRDDDRYGADYDPYLDSIFDYPGRTDTDDFHRDYARSNSHPDPLSSGRRSAVSYGRERSNYDYDAFASVPVTGEPDRAPRRDQDEYPPYAERGDAADDQKRRTGQKPPQQKNTLRKVVVGTAATLLVATGFAGAVLVYGFFHQKSISEKDEQIASMTDEIDRLNSEISSLNEELREARQAIPTETVFRKQNAFSDSTETSPTGASEAVTEAELPTGTTKTGNSENNE